MPRAKIVATIATETGWAELKTDDSMTVDNSGYRQYLTPEQVHAAWSDSHVIPYNEDDKEELEMDYEGKELEEALAHGAARWDGDFWDFGDEQHVIPAKDDFDE